MKRILYFILPLSRALHTDCSVSKENYFVEVVKITASIAAAKDAPPKTLRQSRSAKDARETLLKAIPQRAYTHTHK